MAKQSAQPPKGTRDFLPAELRKRRYVTDVIRGVYERHGFEPLETPAIERLDALLGKYGEEGDQLLFKILRRGQPLVEGIRNASAHMDAPGGLVEGRSGVTAPGAEPLLGDLGLRYDLTVPLSRVVASHQGKLPSVFKRYQIQPVWRADTPGRGRFREFYQCDVDVVGSASPLVEADVTAAAATALRELGFSRFDIRINHRGLLRAVIQHVGIDAAAESDALVALDKLDKLGRDGVSAELARRGIAGAARDRLLDLLGEDADLKTLRERLSGEANAAGPLDELDRVLSLCADTPAASHMRFDPRLARGLSYYTGCIFEVSVEDLAGSIGAGGRYDDLIGMFLGKPIPACGFSLGLERVLVVMDERGMFPPSLRQLDVTLAAADASRLDDAVRLSATLRDAGLSVDLRPDRVKPGKLRKLADEQGVAAAVWLEADAEGKASVWRRQDGETHSDVPFAQLAAQLGTERP